MDTARGERRGAGEYFYKNINNLIQQHCARNNTARAQGETTPGKGLWAMGDFSDELLVMNYE